MKNFFKSIYEVLEPKYILRQYVFGIIIFGVLMHLSNDFRHIGMTIFLTLCLILYPFAMLVYDELVRFLMGSNFFLLPLIILIPWKLIKMLLIYTFSIFIAPIGFIYLTIVAQTRKSK